MFECVKSQYILYKDSNFLRDIQIFVIEKRLKIKDFLRRFLHVCARKKTHFVLHKIITFRFTKAVHFVLPD